MHQILTQMYLTVCIGPLYMEIPTELFLKNSSFDVQPIFPHLNLPTKIPQTGTCHFNGAPHFPHPVKLLQETHKSSRQQLIFSVSTLLSSCNSKSPQERFTDHHKKDFSLLAPSSNYRVINFSPVVSLNVNRNIISIMGYRTPRLTHLLGSRQTGQTIAKAGW